MTTTHAQPALAPPPAVVASRLTRRFGRDVHALCGCSFALPAAKLSVLVGPSGCGKTTALRTLAGLDQPDAGSIHFDGRDLTHQPPSARHVAMVFQTPALYHHLNVAKNLLVGVARADRTASAERAARIAEALRITALLRRKPAGLSLGEQQRVALAKAIVRQPALLLLDEPLASLDPHARGAARAELVRALGLHPMTALLVTHDQAEALELAEHVIVLRAGRVEQEASPEEVIDRPANRFVAGFFGEPVINLLAATARVAGPCVRISLEAWGACVQIERARMPSIGEAQPEPIQVGLRAGDGLVAAPFSGFNGAGDPTRAACEPEGGPLVLRSVVRRVRRLGTGVHVELAPATTEAPQRLHLRLPGAIEPAPDQRIDVAFALSRLHVFERDEPGRRLGPQ